MTDDNCVGADDNANGGNVVISEQVEVEGGYTRVAGEVELEADDERMVGGDKWL
jgi:hypothetical protein